MALVESLVTKSLSEGVLGQVFSVVVGLCSTIWVGFVVFAHITAPVAIVFRLLGYLDAPSAAQAVSPVAGWCERHTLLFVASAVIAGVMFNVGGALVLRIRGQAPVIGWVFFLPAVQGIGVWAAAGIVVALGAVAFGLGWLGVRDHRASPWYPLRTNIAQIGWCTLYPLTLLAGWLAVAYRGDLPASNGEEEM